jgi:hypothetical protein
MIYCQKAFDLLDRIGWAEAETVLAPARLGRFDVDLDTDDASDAGWLDVTHTLTYTNALRWAWTADPSPEVLRGVLHAAWFVQWTGKFDAKGDPRPVLARAGSDAGQCSPPSALATRSRRWH